MKKGLTTAFLGLIVLIILTFVVLSRMSSKSASNTALKAMQTQAATKATWLWKTPYSLSEQEMETYLDQAKNEGFNTIYVSIDHYIDILEQEDKEKSKEEKALFDQKLEKAVQSAHERNIRFQALVGNPTFVESEKQYIPLAFIDYITEFNSSHDQKIEGIQFDIEFYNQPDYEENKTKMMREYLHLIKKMSYKVDKQFTLGLAVPHWFAGEEGNFIFEGDVGSLTHHISRYLSKNPNNYLAIMSYRNEAQGPNGVLAIAKKTFPDIQYNPVKVIVSVDTSPVEEKNVSFYGMKKQDVLSTLNEIDEHFKKEKNYEGFAVHDLEYYTRILANP